MPPTLPSSTMRQSQRSHQLENPLESTEPPSKRIQRPGDVDDDDVEVRADARPRAPSRLLSDSAGDASASALPLYYTSGTSTPPRATSSLAIHARLKPPPAPQSPNRRRDSVVTALEFFQPTLVRTIESSTASLTTAFGMKVSSSIEGATTTTATTTTSAGTVVSSASASSAVRAHTVSIRPPPAHQPVTFARLPPKKPADEENEPVKRAEEGGNKLSFYDLANSFNNVVLPRPSSQMSDPESSRRAPGLARSQSFQSEGGETVVLEQEDEYKEPGVLRRFDDCSVFINASIESGEEGLAWITGEDGHEGLSNGMGWLPPRRASETHPWSDALESWRSLSRSFVFRTTKPARWGEAMLGLVRRMEEETETAAPSPCYAFDEASGTALMFLSPTKVLVSGVRTPWRKDMRKRGIEFSMPLDVGLEAEERSREAVDVSEEALELRRLQQNSSRLGTRSPTLHEDVRCVCAFESLSGVRDAIEVVVNQAATTLKILARSQAAASPAPLRRHRSSPPPSEPLPDLDSAESSSSAAPLIVVTSEANLLDFTAKMPIFDVPKMGTRNNSLDGQAERRIWVAKLKSRTWLMGERADEAFEALERLHKARAGGEAPELRVTCVSHPGTRMFSRAVNILNW